MEVKRSNRLVHEKKITSSRHVELAESTSIKRPFLTIAEDVEGEARNSLVLNKIRISQMAAVKAPDGDRRKAMLEDCYFDRNRMIAEDLGIDLNKMEPKNWVQQNESSLVRTTPQSLVVLARLKISKRESLKSNVKSRKPLHCDRENSRAFAKLSGGVAVIP